MALPAESKDKNATISTYDGYKTKMDLGIKSPLSLIREVQFLLRHCNPGGWEKSAEETALVMSALIQEGARFKGLVFKRAVESILARQNIEGTFQPSYQGIYAKGWNYEEPISTALAVIRVLDWYVNL